MERLSVQGGGNAGDKTRSAHRSPEQTRVAGVESMSHSHPFRESAAITPPPAHDTSEGGMVPGESPVTGGLNTATHSLFETPPSDAFGRHFFRCFFCRIGDNRIEDHFCETGRELIVAMLDEIHDRETS